LIIPHYLSYLTEVLPSDHAHKVGYLCELFLLRSHHIFFDKEKIERISTIALGCFDEVSEDEILEIKDMMDDK
jgi:hypothetical protein